MIGKISEHRTNAYSIRGPNEKSVYLYALRMNKIKEKKNTHSRQFWCVCMCEREREGKGRGEEKEVFEQGHKKIHNENPQGRNIGDG